MEPQEPAAVKPATTKTPRRRHLWRIARLVLYGLLLIMLAARLLPGTLEACFHDFAAEVHEPLSSRTESHFHYIRDHLRQPFLGYGTTKVMLPQFAEVTLSHMACGLMNLSVSRPGLHDDLVPLIDEVAARATSPLVSPWGKRPDEVDDFDDQGLYLSHLNLVLGCHRAITGSDRYEALHRRISEHLSERSLRDGDFHAASYPPDYKWPADQSVTLCSLYLYDRTHGTTLSTEPIAGWLAWMREHTDPATGLPHSAVSEFSYSRTPRGCALSWSILYMAQFAPDEAADLYQTYRQHFFVSCGGVGGFREWPQGAGGASDVDSGPVVLGVGAAASGLGVGPARLYGDEEAYADIMRTLSMTTLPSPWGDRSYLAMPVLAEAILFDGETAVPWYQPVPLAPTVAATKPAFPALPLLAAVLEAGLAALLACRLRGLWRKLRHSRRKTPAAMSN
jgi:hypothetical protein